MPDSIEPLIAEAHSPFLKKKEAYKLRVLLAYYKTLLPNDSEHIENLNTAISTVDYRFPKSSLREWLGRPVIIFIITTVFIAPMTAFLGFYLESYLHNQEAQQPNQAKYQLGVQSEEKPNNTVQKCPKTPCPIPPNEK